MLRLDDALQQDFSIRCQYGKAAFITTGIERSDVAGKDRTARWFLFFSPVHSIASLMRVLHTKIQT